MIRVAVLGPLTVEHDGQPIQVTGGLRRALLARLAIDAGRVVSVDRLVEDLWGGSPPKSAVGTIQTYVSQLRKQLGDALVTRPPGYLIDLPHDAVDLRRFETAVAEDRHDDALAVWRDEPLAEFADQTWAHREGERLASLRLDAVEGRLRARLEGGDAVGLVAECEAVIAEHPLREGVWEVLITALYRSGRQSDALRAYQRLRAVLTEELGIDPSPELQALERAVLNQEVPALSPPTDRAPEGRALPTGVVTFVLTDIEGSTNRWDVDPDGMAAALELHDDLIEEAVVAAGGRLLKSKGEGDATFSVFGRASDALVAAVRVQDLLAGADWPGDDPLAVRVALVTGEAIERNDDYYGTTVNRAARLRALARGGEILVGESTAGVVRDHLPDGVALHPLGRRDLPGLSRPESVWVIGAPDEPPREAIGDEGTADAGLRIGLPVALAVSEPVPCVGRDVELDRLRTAWRSKGKERLVLVSGEPGIGKTRLVAELAGEVHRDGGVVLHGRCDPDLGVPYQPFAEAIGRLVDALPGALIAEHRGAYGPVLGHLAPPVAAKLGLAAGTFGGADDPDMRGLVFSATADLLDRVAARQGVLVVLDDLHWADQPSLALLRHLHRSETDNPIMMIGTYRDTDLSRVHPLSETLSELRRNGDPPRIMVGGLTATDVVTYLEATSNRALSPSALALAEATHAETSGNPFFLSQVIRHLAESDTLADTVQRWEQTGDFDLPQGAVDAVGRRLSSLDDATGRLLTWACVCGHQFDLATLEAADPDLDPADRLDALDQALHHRLILDGEQRGQYRFAHAIVRDVIYDELSTARRAHIHQRVADVLADDPAARPAVLAHHYAQVARPGHTADAVTWACRAAQDALGRAAFVEAASHAANGLDLLDLDAQPDLRQRAELLILRSSALLAEEHPDSRDAWFEAVAAARTAGDVELEVRAAHYPGWINWREIDPERDAVIEAALDHCAELPPDSRLRVEFVANYARHAADKQIFLAIDDLPKAGDLTRARHAADEVLVPALDHPDLQLRSAALVGLSRLEASADLARLTTGLAPEHLDALRSTSRPAPYWAHLCIMDVARAHYLVGDRARAFELLDLWRRVSAESPTTRRQIAFNEVIVLIDSGNFTELDDLLAVLDATDDGVGWARESYPAGVRWRIAHHRGDLAQAAEEVRGREGGAALAWLAAVARALDGDVAEGLALVEARTKSGWLFSIGRRRLDLGQAAVIVTAAKHRELAQPLLDQVEPYAGQLLAAGVAVSFGAADRARGTLLWVLDRFDEAVAALEAAVELEERMDLFTWATWSRYWLARALIDRSQPGDDARARTVLDEALAFADRVGMGWIQREGRLLLDRLDIVPLPAPLARLDGPFVGRDAQRDELLSLVNEGTDDRRVVLVVGEPGIGKTRLVAEACHAAHDEGAMVLFGHCDDGIGAPFQPFAEAVRTLVSSLGDQRVQEIADTHARSLTAVVPELATDGAPAPEWEAWAVNEALDAFLSRLARARPVVVVVDDLHWATPSTLAAVRHLVTSTRDGALTLVATYRDTDLDRSRPLADTMADLRRSTDIHRIVLRGLDDHATTELVGALGTEPAEESFAHEVALRTEGNPFFVRQLVGHARESGDTDSVPEGIREVVGHRLNRLGDAANKLLRTASVMGREFDLAVLEAAGGPAADAGADAAEEALAAGLITEVPDTFGRYEFGHALLRQTLYDELSTNRRVRTHWRIAGALSKGANPPLATIAHHRVEGALAGDPLVAVDACIDATAQAIRRGAPLEAEPVIDVAIELLDQQPHDDGARRANLLLAQFWIDRANGSPRARASETLSRVLRVAEDHDLTDERVAAIENLSWATDLKGRRPLEPDAVIARIESALAGRAGHRPDLRRRLEFARSAILSEPVHLQPPMGDPADPHVVGDERPEGHPWLTSWISAVGAAGIEWTSPDLEQVAARIEASRELLATTVEGPPYMPGGAAWVLAPALLATRAGDRERFDRAVADVHASLDTRRYPFFTWIHHHLAALVPLVDGDLTAARLVVDTARRELPVHRIIGQLAWHIRLEKAELATVLGQMAPLLADPRGAWSADTCARAAWVRHHLGQHDEAAAWLDDFAAQGYWTRGEVGAGHLGAYAIAADLIAEQMDAPHASELEEIVAPYAGQLLVAGLSTIAPIASADRALGQLAFAQGRHDDAVARLRAGLAVEEDFRAPVLAARSRYWLARVLAERDAPGDPVEAATLIAQCRTETASMGLVQLAGMVEALAARWP